MARGHFHRVNWGLEKNYVTPYISSMGLFRFRQKFIGLRPLLIFGSINCTFIQITLFLSIQH